MMKFLLPFILGITFMTNTKAIEYKHPEFTLQVTITGVGADIRLNDISIEFEKFNGNSTTTYDVNQYVIAGENKLKIITFPFLGETPEDGQSEKYHSEAEIKVAFYVNEKNEPNRKRLLSQIHFLPSLNKDTDGDLSQLIESIDSVKFNKKSQSLSFPRVTFNQQIIATRNTIKVQKNYPRWAWQDGLSIENTSENLNTLTAFYRKIHSAYQESDRDKLYSIHNDAAKEYSLAYYLLGGVKEGHLFLGTADILNDPNAKLYNFFMDGTKLDIFADGKLARIIDIDQYHPVHFDHKTLDITCKLKFAFYKNKQNKWIMIR